MDGYTGNCKVKRTLKITSILLLMAMEVGIIFLVQQFV